MILRLFNEGFQFAVTALWSNRLRTVLSLLGITIGIFAVISVFTFVDSWEMRIRKSLSALGDDVVYIEKWPWQFNADYAWWKYVNRPVASYREYELLKDRTQLASAVSMTTNLSAGTVKAGSLSLNNASVRAVTHDYSMLRELDFANGRYFSNSESQFGARVVILGASVADVLFPDIDPIGRDLLLLGQKLRVVGLLKAEGNSAIGMSSDAEFIVPINFVRKVRGNDFSKLYPLILIKPLKGIPIYELREEVRGHLRAIRRIAPTAEDNFALNQISFIANQLDQLFSVLKIIGWLIGGFSILVGGFGIANIMFVSVYERTGQIGIQKALGAKRFFILLQFLIESVVLSLLGGLLGLALVWVMTLVANQALDLELSLTYYNMFLACAVSVVIGLLAGTLPALRASRMDPVEAIRFN
ncbi:MAG: ABC transporter permease [Bacteroidia bacterium]